MLISNSDNIYLLEKLTVNELEAKFDQLYDQALELSDDPNSEKYQRVKSELLTVYQAKDRLLRK